MLNEYNCAIMQDYYHGEPEKQYEYLKNILNTEKESHNFDLLALPELYGLPYFCQSIDSDNFKYAEPLRNHRSDFFSQLASEHKIVILRPFFEEVIKGVYANSCAVYDRDGSIAGLYRKMHIPDDPCFYEKYYFTPGSDSFEPVVTSIGKIGVLICWDQWFPEAARILALKGVDIIFYPTAIGILDGEESQKEKFINNWKVVQSSHAIANNVYVAAINRTGREDKIDFWGNSFVVAPDGEEIVSCCDEKTLLRIFKVEKQLIGDTRITWPFLRDRRVEHYSDIGKKF